MVPEQFGGLEARTFETGTDDSGLGKRMGLGKLFGKKGNGEGVSRRDVLKGAGKAGIGVAAAHLGGLGFSSEAEAGGFHEIEVPPIIELDAQEDISAKMIYRFYQKNDYMIEHRRDSTKVAKLRLLRQGAVGERPEKESYIRLPSLWFMAAELDIIGGVNREVISKNKLRRKNEAMFFFAEGISWYMDHWVRDDQRGYQEPYLINNFIDSNLGASILAAAGRKNPMSEYKHLRFEMTNAEQEKYLVGLRDVLMERDKHDQRVALWASYWLVNNFIEQGSNITRDELKTRDLIYSHIETDLGEVNEKIRTSPKLYNIS